MLIMFGSEGGVLRGKVGAALPTLLTPRGLADVEEVGPQPARRVLGQPYGQQGQTQSKQVHSHGLVALADKAGDADTHEDEALLQLRGTGHHGGPEHLHHEHKGRRQGHHFDRQVDLGQPGLAIGILEAGIAAVEPPLGRGQLLGQHHKSDSIDPQEDQEINDEPSKQARVRIAAHFHTEEWADRSCRILPTWFEFICISISLAVLEVTATQTCFTNLCFAFPSDQAVGLSSLSIG